MGLDMYLIRRKKGQKDFENWYDHDEVAYWRKANAIHLWFVDNVQDGVDDCDYYQVSKENVEDLRNICKELLDRVILEDAKVRCGQQWNHEKNEWEDILKDGQRIVNQELCDELLPTTEGFFFGSTDYDQWYLDDVKFTFDKMQEILDSFDFEENDLYYSSSW